MVSESAAERSLRSVRARDSKVDELLVFISVA